MAKGALAQQLLQRAFAAGAAPSPSAAPDPAVVPRLPWEDRAAEVGFDPGPAAALESALAAAPGRAALAVKDWMQSPIVGRLAREIGSLRGRERERDPCPHPHDPAP